MTATVEILLTSDFESAGVDAARAKIEKLVNDLKGKSLTGEQLMAEGDVFPTGAVEDFAQEMGHARDEARELARAATELADNELANKLLQIANTADQLSKRWKELGSLTKTEVIQNFTTAGQTLHQMVVSLQKAANAERQLAAAQIEAQQTTKAEIHLQRAQAIDQEANSINKLDNGLQGLTATGTLTSETIIKGFTKAGQTLDQMVVSLEKAAHQAREFAEASLRGGEEDKAKIHLKNAQAIDKEAQAIKKLNKELKMPELKKLALSATQIAKKFTRVGQSLEQMSKSLKKAAQNERKLAEEQKKALATDKAKVHLKNAQNIDREAASINKLDNELKELTATQQQFGEFGDEFRDVTSVDQAKNKLEELRHKYEQVRDAAFEAGDLAGAIGASEQTKKVEALDKSLFGATGTFKNLGKEMGVWGNVMTLSFNQMGFAIFVTTSTIKSLLLIVKGITTAIKDAFTSIDLLNAFAAAAKATAVSTDALRDQLVQASGGYIDYNELLRATIELNLAGGESFVDLTDDMASAARGLEILTGTPALEFFNAFKDAVIEGDAAGLEFVLGFEKVAEIIEATALEAADFPERFEDFDKAAFASQLIIDTLKDLNIELENLESASSSLRVASINLTTFFADLKTAVVAGALPLASLASGFKDSTKAAANFGKILPTILFGLDKLVTGIGLLVTIPFVHFFESITILAEGAVAAFEGLKEGLSLSEIKDQLDEIAEKGIEESLSKEFWEDFWNADGLIEAYEEVDNALGLGRDQIEENALAIVAAIRKIQEAMSGVKLIFDMDTSPALEQLEFFLSDEFKFMEESAEAWEEYGDKISEINLQKGRDIFRIKKESNEDLLELDEEYAEDSIDIAEDLADKLFKVDDDLAFKEGRAREDASDKREKKEKKHKKKIEDIEENHQRKINDILRKFDLSKLSALIDRDARALHQAEMARDEGLRKAQEDADRKREQEDESNKDALDDIDENEDKKIERMREDANRRRQELQKQHAKDMKELAEQLDEDLEARKEKRDDDIKDAKQKALSARIQAKKDYNKENAALLDQFNKEKAIENAQSLLQEIRFQTNADNLSDITQSRIDNLEDDLADGLDIITDYVDDVVKKWGELGDLEHPDLGIPGSGTGDDEEVPQPPPPPPPPPPTPLGMDIRLTEGARCNVSNGITYVDNFGILWKCIGKAWTIVGKEAPGRVQSETNQISSFANVNQVNGIDAMQSNALSSGRVKATLVVEGNDVLKALIEEVTTDVFIEITEVPTT